MADQNQPEVQSPCIGVCSIDESTGFCLGCYRTVDEIKTWWEMPPTAQKQLLQVLDARQATSTNFD